MTPIIHIIQTLRYVLSTADRYNNTNTHIIVRPLANTQHANELIRCAP